MTEIVPFRAWRFSPTAGDLTDLVAPPYDVVDGELRSRLQARNPHNVIRVDLPLELPSDNPCHNRYTRAAALLAQWKQSGVLVRDQSPSLTFVEEEFVGPDGRSRSRHGFLAAVRLHDFSEGVVFPHEQTFSGPKEDRWRLMVATHMGLSPVFLLYDLPGDDVTAAWKAGPGTTEPRLTVTDEQGTVTRLWPVTDEALAALVREALSSSPLIIADGHHRYETALRYRDWRRQEEGFPGISADKIYPGDERRAAGAGASASGAPAYEYVLAYLSNLADPALAVYATHRLVTGLDADRVRALPEKLAEDFVVESLRPAADPTKAVAAYLEQHPRGAFAMWGQLLGQPYGLELRDPAALDQALSRVSRAYRQLDVVILQYLVLQKALGIVDRDATERHLTYFKDPEAAFERLARGEFQVGFFLNPTGLDQVRELALSGERMPHKATYFYPKLPTGLVFYDLEGRV